MKKNETEKRSFVFYPSWMDECEDMTDSEMLEYLKAIIAYGTSGEQTAEDRYVKGRMVSVKREIDAANERYDKTSQVRKEAGRKGADARRIKEAVKQVAEALPKRDGGQKLATQEEKACKQKTAKQANAAFAEQAAANASIDIDKDNDISSSSTSRKIQDEEDYSDLMTHHDDSHNVSGLIETLRLYGIYRKDSITAICVASDYGLLGGKVWKVLAESRMTFIDGKLRSPERYILNSLGTA